MASMLFDEITAQPGNGDRPWLIGDQRTWSRDELVAEVHRWSSRIERLEALGPDGDSCDTSVTAVLLSDPTTAFIVALASEQAGSVPALLHPGWWQREHTGALDRLRPTIVVTDEDFAGRVPTEFAAAIITDTDVEERAGDGPTPIDGQWRMNPALDPEPGDQIRFSGGTSGEPTPHLVRARVQGAPQLNDNAPWLDGTAVVGTSHPAEPAGRDIATHVLSQGGTVRFIERWGPAALLRVLSDDRIVTLTSASSHLERLAVAIGRGETPHLPDLRQLEAFGGMLHRRAGVELGRGLAASVCRAYRHSAVGGVVASVDIDEIPAVTSSARLGVGRLSDNGSASVTGDAHGWAGGGAEPVGELIITRPHGATNTNDIVTGDLAAIDDGDIHLGGRAADRFTTDGHDVTPGEVEAALTEHPGVASAAVVGRPDAERGSIGVAVIVPVDPENPPFLTDLAAHLDGLAPWAHPSAQWITAQLPLAAHGAVHRRMLAHEEASR